jgi:hypothetical protein
MKVSNQKEAIVENEIRGRNRHEDAGHPADHKRHHEA